jgi:hypothetical protein
MKLIKEIRSKEGKLHFRRWEILKTRWFSIYIHGIYEADQDKHLHNHPWDYKSIVLKGSYIEETLTGNNVMRPLKMVTRDGKDYHKIKELKSKSVYTLFIVSPVKRIWGYLVDGSWMNHEEYREKKNKGLFGNNND